MIENSKNGTEMDARRRTASHFIFLCEKFLAPAYLLEETKNRRTALKMLSAGSEMSKTGFNYKIKIPHCFSSPKSSQRQLCAIR